MAAFSSRGRPVPFIKPDITAPGVQILAGHTPTPRRGVRWPPGEYVPGDSGDIDVARRTWPVRPFSCVPLHPTWTPGQIKSALMTTARTAVVKEDTVTPADPFDIGAGRIDVDEGRRCRL